MRAILTDALLSLVLFTPVTSTAQLQCGAPGTYAFLLLPLHPQETDAWCWAAAAQMVMEYQDSEPRHRTTLTAQCDLVSDVFRGDLTTQQFHTCCTRPKLAVCYRAYYVQMPFLKFGFNWDWKPLGGINWNDLVQQLCAKKPFVATMNQNEEGWHVYVVDGFLRISFSSIDWKLVSLYDPYAGYRLKTFENFLDDPGMDEWHDGSYVDILPFPNPTP